MRQKAVYFEYLRIEEIFSRTNQTICINRLPANRPNQYNFDVFPFKLQQSNSIGYSGGGLPLYQTESIRLLYKMNNKLLNKNVLVNFLRSNDFSIVFAKHEINNKKKNYENVINNFRKSKKFNTLIYIIFIYQLTNILIVLNLYLSFIIIIFAYHDVFSNLYYNKI